MALRFNKVLANTRESDHYCTPKDFYQKLHDEFGFTFDPCPLRCETFNGLEVDWNGIVYVNPPYSRIEAWIEKGRMKYCNLLHRQYLPSSYHQYIFFG